MASGQFDGSQGQRREMQLREAGGAIAGGAIAGGAIDLLWGSSSLGLLLWLADLFPFRRLRTGPPGFVAALSLLW
jgi:hypothetical protein